MVVQLLWIFELSSGMYLILHFKLFLSSKKTAVKPYQDSAPPHGGAWILHQQRIWFCDSGILEDTNNTRSGPVCNSLLKTFALNVAAPSNATLTFPDFCGWNAGCCGKHQVFFWYPCKFIFWNFPRITSTYVSITCFLVLTEIFLTFWNLVWISFNLCSANW